MNLQFDVELKKAFDLPFSGAVRTRAASPSAAPAAAENIQFRENGMNEFKTDTEFFCVYQSFGLVQSKINSGENVWTFVCLFMKRAKLVMLPLAL